MVQVSEFGQITQFGVLSLRRAFNKASGLLKLSVPIGYRDWIHTMNELQD
jgi:hypothetical protein